MAPPRAQRARVARALPQPARHGFLLARNEPAEPHLVKLRRRQIVDQLFWALLYWLDPDGYEELVAGEQIHPGLLDSLDIDGRVVADLGAGAGRFTLVAARRATQVIAVDAVPALLERLQRHADAQELHNIEVRRGAFTKLPLDDSSVDVAVACSSLTSHPPWGGECALEEAERIVKPGGEVVVIWPNDPSWFCERGFTYATLPGATEMHFESVAAAERICGEFYSAKAAHWVHQHDVRVVPFDVLGVPPPSDACIKRVGTDDVPPSRPYGDDHRLPGVEVP